MDIRSVSFHVFFDGYNKAREDAIVGDTNTVKVILTGNKYQLQGFICFFFAMYGSQGLNTDEMITDDLLKYHHCHFEDDINTSELASLGERYVINLIYTLDGENLLQFLTSHLEDFVSGMEAVPPQIELTDGSIILPNYINLTWKHICSYIDLNDPEQYDLYTNTEDIDAFENTPTLETVNTKEVSPMAFTIKKCTYVMPKATIFQYLESCERGNPIKGPVNTLEMVYWASSWTSIHTIALTQICHRLKITNLYCVSRNLQFSLFERLAKNATPEYCPFLPQLEKIEIDFRGSAPPFWDLM